MDSLKVSSSMSSDDALPSLNWIVGFSCNLDKMMTELADGGSPPCRRDNPSTDDDTNVEGSCSTQEIHAKYRTNAEERPPWSYGQLITRAMIETGNRRMTLNEIYQWFERNFAFFRCTDSSWKNSVRHTLSSSKRFLKVSKKKTDRGKGGYWELSKDCAVSKDSLMKRSYSLQKRSVRGIRRRPRAASLRQPPTIQSAAKEPQTCVFLGIGGRESHLEKEDSFFIDKDIMWNQEQTDELLDNIMADAILSTHEDTYGRCFARDRIGVNHPFPRPPPQQPTAMKPSAATTHPFPSPSEQDDICTEVDLLKFFGFPIGCDDLTGICDSYATPALFQDL